MSGSNEKLYEAVTVAGGESGRMTLQDARDQAKAWNDKGYTAYVTHVLDDSWEDVEITAPITPSQVADSLGHDREALKDFVAKLMDMLDYDVSERVGGFMVYTYEGD